MIFFFLREREKIWFFKNKKHPIRKHLVPSYHTLYFFHKAFLFWMRSSGIIFFSWPTVIYSKHAVTQYHAWGYLHTGKCGKQLETQEGIVSNVVKRWFGWPYFLDLLKSVWKSSLKAPADVNQNRSYLGLSTFGCITGLKQWWFYFLGMQTSPNIILLKLYEVFSLVEFTVEL